MGHIGNGLEVGSLEAKDDVLCVLHFSRFIGDAMENAILSNTQISSSPGKVYPSIVK